MFPESTTMSLLSLLPSVSCLSPLHTLQHIRADMISRKLFLYIIVVIIIFYVSTPEKSQVTMDEEQFKSESFQRAYQYIRRHAQGADLDAFFYRGIPEGTPEDSLKHILK